MFLLSPVTIAVVVVVVVVVLVLITAPSAAVSDENTSLCD
jgi:uncharacterized membrane protein